MDNFEKHYLGMFEIDHVKNSADFVGLKTNTVGLKDWLITVILNIIDKASKKEYKFSSDTVEVNTCAVAIIGGSPEDNPQAIAERLLREEIEAQKSVKGMKDLKRGSLLQILFTLGEQKYFLLAKVEQVPFLDRKDYEKHVGLPFKNQIFKACLILVDNDDQIGNIFIYDSNSTISKYWWNSFLETVELNSDQRNTKRCYEKIDLLLKLKLRKFKSDYTEINNNIKGYFLSNKTFNMDEFVVKIFDEYTLEGTGLDIGNIKAAVLLLPKDAEFDTKFNIERSEIKKHFKRVVKLSSNLELKITNSIEDLGAKIRPVEVDKRKYLVIETVEGYAHFKKQEVQKEKATYDDDPFTVEAFFQ